MQKSSLLEQYLCNFISSKDNWIMSIQSSYFRLFPLLLGSSRSRINFTASFVSKFTSQKTPDESFNSSEYDQEAILQNPFYKKYAEKILKLKQSNLDEYKKRMKLLQSMHSLPNNEKPKNSEYVKKEQTIDPLPNKTVKARKSLEDILNVEKVQSLTAEEIRGLWVEYYSTKDAVCAVIPSAAYCSVQTIAKQYPVFVYPIPRQDGFEMFVGQFADDEFHFTSLLNYQKHQENAPSQFDIKHYTELEKDKDIVLMSGLVFDEGISVTDAQLLSYLVQHFYMEHPRLVRDFNLSPNTFNYDNVINAVDKTLLSKAGYK